MLSRLLAVFLLAVLIFSGCATAPHFVTSDNLAKVNRISSLSLLGEKIELKHLGTTIFTNELSYQNVDWDIDQYIEGIIQNEITANTKYQYINLEFSKNKLNAAETKKIYDAETGVPHIELDFKDIEEYLQKASREYKIDTLILITRGTTEIPGTPQYITGYSLHTRSFLSVLKQQPIFFCAVNIKVIDLRSMRVIASAGIVSSKKADENTIKKEYGELSPDEQKNIETILKEMLMNELPLRMLSLGIVPVNYSDGINRTEANILAETFIHDRLPDTCKLTNPFELGNTWHIDLWQCDRDKEFPSVIIDKTTGEITWNHSDRKSP